MDNKLKTLEEFNESQIRKYKKTYVYNNGNGIKCPSCGDELFDLSTNVLLSFPPQKEIYCKVCGYKGFRIL